MSFDRSIALGKERRRPFNPDHKKDYAKSVDRTCRNHGTCHTCKTTRLHADKKWRSLADEQMDDFLRGEYD